MQKIYLFVDFYVDMKILCILFVLYINSQTSKFTITKPQRFMGKKYLGRLFSNLGIWGFTFQLNRKDISVFPTANSGEVNYKYLGDFHKYTDFKYCPVEFVKVVAICLLNRARQPNKKKT